MQLTSRRHKNASDGIRLLAYPNLTKRRSIHQAIRMDDFMAGNFAIQHGSKVSAVVWYGGGQKTGTSSSAAQPVLGA